MNGAVQGVATIVARTPVKKAPAETRPRGEPAAGAGERRRQSPTTPERLNPIANSR